MFWLNFFICSTVYGNIASVLGWLLGLTKEICFMHQMIFVVHLLSCNSPLWCGTLCKLYRTAVFNEKHLGPSGLFPVQKKKKRKKSFMVNVDEKNNAFIPSTKPSFLLFMWYFLSYLHPDLWHWKVLQLLTLRFENWNSLWWLIG
jgi:hypothetical protein